MVSIFSSALFLAFSLGGFSFGGVLSSVGSVDSVLAGAGFDSAGLASVEAGRLRDGRIFSIRACMSRKSCFRDVRVGYCFPDWVGYWEGF